MLGCENVPLKNIQVSFNKYWSPWNLFEEVESVEELLKGVTVPSIFSHVAVYCPQYKRFKSYDVISIVYENATTKAIYGYQLKERKEFPRGLVNGIDRSYAIRRNASSQKLETCDGWTVVSEETMDDFLGVSGRSLAPKEWRNMH